MLILGPAEIVEVQETQKETLSVYSLRSWYGRFMRVAATINLHKLTTKQNNVLLD